MSSFHHVITTTFNTLTLLLLLLLISIHPQTASPTNHPSVEPTSDPTSSPIPIPTPEPTPNPTHLPTPEPTSKPSRPNPTLTTSNPTSNPTESLPPQPTTETPSNIPTSQPTSNPTLITISPTLKPTSNPTTLIPTTRFPTNVPTSNLTETTIPWPKLMHAPDGAKCFIGSQCMKRGECCLGDIEKMKGVYCKYKQCCIDIGYNGCFHDHNCCRKAGICSNGQCIYKAINDKKYKAMKKMHSALIDDKDGDDTMLQTFDSVTANSHLKWILIGVSAYVVIMIMLFGIYKFVKCKKKLNTHTNDEIGGTTNADYI